MPGVRVRCRRVLASRCAGGWCARALSACAGVEVRGRLVCAGVCGEDAGGWCARALSACAGVEVRGRLACAGLARAGYEGVARMWIGYEDVDRL